MQRCDDSVLSIEETGMVLFTCKGLHELYHFCTYEEKLCKIYKYGSLYLCLLIKTFTLSWRLSNKPLDFLPPGRHFGSRSGPGLVMCSSKSLMMLCASAVSRYRGDGSRDSDTHTHSKWSQLISGLVCHVPGADRPQAKPAHKDSPPKTQEEDGF